MPPTRFPAGVSDAGERRRSGVTTFRGTRTVATGLDTVTSVTVSLAAVGVAAGDPFVATGRPSGTAGSIDLAAFQDDGTAATASAIVHWTAAGT